MAHEVETMTYRGQVPWHGLGNPLSDAGLTNWLIACQEAGLDWEVELVPLILGLPEKASAEIMGRVAEMAKASVRVSDGKILGVVGPDYTVLQNRDAFEWFAPIVESGAATFEAAGSLREGSRVWALAKVAGLTADVRPGDSVERYVLLSHAHDGTMSIRVGFTDVRVVCMNTLRAAHESDASKLIRIRHTAQAKDNLEAVREVMDIAASEFHATLLEYHKLQQREGISPADVMKYVMKVLDTPKDADGKVSKRVMDRIEGIVKLAWEGIGNTGTSMWDAFNAVTQWATWERGRNQENRVNAAWFGEGREITDRALKYGLAMCDPDFVDFETNGKASEPLVEAEIEGEPLDKDFTA